MIFRLSKNEELNDTLIKKILELHQKDIFRLNMLEDYSKGKTKIFNKIQSDTSKPCNKVNNPFPAYIVNTMSGYFVGEPISYSSSDSKALDALNFTLEYTDAQAEDMEIETLTSIYGVAYELLYIDEDSAIRLAHIKPQDMIVIYNDNLTSDIIYAIRIIPMYDIINEKKYYNIEIYDAETIKTYKSNEQLSQLDFISEEKHYFGIVPIIEYKNNEQMMGDFEQVIPLIDAYDSLTSDSLDTMDYFNDCYMILRGVLAEDSDIQQMKNNRVIVFPDSEASAEFLIKPSNDTEMENLKNRIKNDIHKFSCVPDLSDKDFTSNASGIAIQFKLLGTENLASVKERYFKLGLQKRIELIFNILAIKSDSYDWRSIDIVFTRNIPTNISELANVVSNLSAIVSNETLLSILPFVENPADEMEKINKERETNPFYNLTLESGYNSFSTDSNSSNDNTKAEV